jgi:hypothetical protein
MKKCPKCKTEKILEEFHFSSKGKTKRSSYCKECSRKEAYSSFLRNKKLHIERSKNSVQHLYSIVDKIKIKYRCCFCDESEPCCLDFHHPDSNKENDISHLVQLKTKLRLFEEINKCIVVCSNCHRKIHRNLLSCKDKKLCNENIYDYFELINTRLRKKKDVNVDPFTN